MPKFKFFEDLPEELTLNIVSKTTRQDQARLLRVDKKFNRIANTESLELFKYKSNNLRYTVGEACLIVNETHNEMFPYELYIIENGKRISTSNMFLSKKGFDEIRAAIKISTLTVIQKLVAMSGTASENAKILLREVEKEGKKQEPNQKSNQKCRIHVVGEVCLIIKEADDSDKSGQPYCLYITKNDKEVKNCYMSIKEQVFNDLSDIMNKGTLALIKELKKRGETATKTARILEEEYEKVEHTQKPTFQK